MRNLLVGTGTAISLILAASVAQADPFNFGLDGPSGPWSGFYLGANGGKSWFNGNDRLNLTGIDNANDPAFATFVSQGKSFSDDGSFGGGQLGYGFQRGVFVLGAEADIERSFFQDDANLVVHNDGTFSASGSSDLDWFGTVRGRLGIAFCNSALLYGTGGFAYGRVDDKLFVTAQDTDSQTNKFTRKETDTGFVWGGGLEFAFNPALSLKAEYQRIELGTSHLSGSAIADSGEDQGDASLRTDHSYDTFRVGLNYHFYRGTEEAAPLK